MEFVAAIEAKRSQSSALPLPVASVPVVPERDDRVVEGRSRPHPHFVVLELDDAERPAPYALRCSNNNLTNSYWSTVSTKNVKED